MTKFHQDELLKKKKTIIYLFGFIGSWLNHIGSSLQHTGPFVMARDGLDMTQELSCPSECGILVH